MVGGQFNDAAFLSTPPILMMLHSVYGAGSFYGLFLLIFGKKK